MALEVNQTDKYTPRKTGVYDVFITEMRTDPSDSSVNKIAQQWSFDAKTSALIPRVYPQKAMFEGFNKNLIVYQNRGMKNQKFDYDLGSHMWYNELTKRAILTEFEASEKGESINTQPMDENDPKMKW